MLGRLGEAAARIEKKLKLRARLSNHMHVNETIRTAG
jgi:hypothetical protein